MITVIVTGNLTDDPRSFSTRDGHAGCELRVAVDLPPRNGAGEGPTRYFKVVAYGVLASHAASSLHKGDRVTVQGHDLVSEAWASDTGDPRSKVAIKATEIAASLRFDTLTTDRALRKATHAAAGDASAQALAGAAVLAGATAS
jgi:single-strand DNA-binding protein